MNEKRRSAIKSYDELKTEMKTIQLQMADARKKK